MYIFCLKKSAFKVYITIFTKVWYDGQIECAFILMIVESQNVYIYFRRAASFTKHN